VTREPFLWCASGGLGRAADAPEAKPNQHWTPAEREEFFQALVTRLWEELNDKEREQPAHRQADAERAVQTAQDALLLCALDFLPVSSPARGQVLELGAALILDQRHTASFVSGNPWAVRAAAAELIRRSDPEARCAGCEVMSKLSATGEELAPLWGDEFTQLIRDRDAYQRSERQRQRGAHFQVR
jgi:hypothetical protein